jgi:hypothetical protein
MWVTYLTRYSSASYRATQSDGNLTLTILVLILRKALEAAYYLKQSKLLTSIRPKFDSNRDRAKTRSIGSNFNEVSRSQTCSYSAVVAFAVN